MTALRQELNSTKAHSTTLQRYLDDLDAKYRNEQGTHHRNVGALQAQIQHQMMQMNNMQVR